MRSTPATSRSPPIPGADPDLLSHVDLHYLRLENHASANTVFIDARADRDLAQAAAVLRNPGAPSARHGGGASVGDSTSG